MDLEQLKARMAGIGGSDAAAVLGVPSARNSALEVYTSKVVEPTEEDRARGALLWGTLLEDAIAGHYGKEHGLRLRSPGTIVRPGEPMVATLDRVQFPDRGDDQTMERGLEVKTSDRGLAWRWGPTGGDKIPEEYWVQVQHYYLVVPTLVRIDVACLIGGNDYREYQIPKDESFVRDLQAAERAWWDRHVTPKLPPEPGERDLQTIKRLYPGTNGETVDLSGMAHWHAVRADAMKNIGELETVRDVALAKILLAMGEAAIGKIPGGGRYERKLVKRTGYEVAPTEYIDARHVKGKAA